MNSSAAGVSAVNEISNESWVVGKPEKFVASAYWLVTKAPELRDKTPSAAPAGAVSADGVTFRYTYPLLKVTIAGHRSNCR